MKRILLRIATVLERLAGWIRHKVDPQVAKKEITLTSIFDHMPAPIAGQEDYRDLGYLDDPLYTESLGTLLEDENGFIRSRAAFKVIGLYVMGSPLADQELLEKAVSVVLEGTHATRGHVVRLLDNLGFQRDCVTNPNSKLDKTLGDLWLEESDIYADIAALDKGMKNSWKKWSEPL